METDFDFIMDSDFSFFDMFEVLEKAPKGIKKEMKWEQRNSSKQAPDFYPEPNWTPTPPDRRP